MNNQQQGQDIKALVGGLCTALAAVSVRISSNKQSNEGILTLVSSCQTSIATNAPSPSFSPEVSLRLLAVIPEEAKSRNDVTTTVIEELLSSVTDPVMKILHAVLYQCMNGSDEMQDALLCQTLHTLTKWAEGCKGVTLSMLNSTTNDGTPNFLS